MKQYQRPREIAQPHRCPRRSAGAIAPQGAEDQPEKLAETLGLTFQQVQKYERGANRISASKLYEIARSLRVSIAWFFEGLSDPQAGRMKDDGETAAPPHAHNFLMTPEGIDLAKPPFPASRIVRCGANWST